MKLNVRFSNVGLVSIMGLIIALLLVRDFSLHRAAPMVVSAPVTAEKVVTKEFCLVDDAGRTRARIAMNEYNAPSLQLFDQSGQQRAQLRLNKDDVPSLRLYDTGGRLRSVTGFNLANEQPVVVMFDENGQGHPGVSLDNGLMSMQIFRDEDSLFQGRPDLYLSFGQSEAERIQRQMQEMNAAQQAIEDVRLNALRAQQEAERANQELQQSLELRTYTR